VDKDAMWEHTAAQRLRLADLLDGLTEEQWATPSLCQGWTVRHVAAHASMSGRWQAGWGIPTFVRAGLRVNRFTDLDARRFAQRPTAEIAQALRDVASVRTHPPFTTVADPLADIQVHSMDVALPLGVDWPLPPDAAAAAANRIWRMGFPFFARRRLRGQRLRATNAHWEAGKGQLIEEPIESLLLRLTGRRHPVR
jgi:uncharacterized protein (TIGR03083 family)